MKFKHHDSPNVIERPRNSNMLVVESALIQPLFLAFSFSEKYTTFQELASYYVVRFNSYDSLGVRFHHDKDV